MSKQSTNIRISPITIGYLHYLVREGETQQLYEIIDVLVANYIEFIAEENEKDIKSINEEAMELYRATRRPQTKRSKQEQDSIAKKSMERLKSNKNCLILWPICQLDTMPAHLTSLGFCIIIV